MKSTESFRIISLVPSLTETLCHFGLIDSIVGCTSFCVEPKELRHGVVSVGGTKDARIDDMLKLKPTHVIVNREENTQALIAELKRLSTVQSFTVVETFLESPADNFELIRSLGETFNFSTEACNWLDQNRRDYSILQQQIGTAKKFEFAYFIWMNPWMVAGNQTYISRTLELIGGVNCIMTGQELKDRYPAVEAKDLRLAHADVLFFSSEPFPFRKRHVEEFQRQSEIRRPLLKVDGQALSWYGSRFSETLVYLRRLHDEIHEAIG